MSKKKKTHFTRKNLIFITVVFFWAFFVLLAGLGLDTDLNVFAKNNPFQKLSVAFGFPIIQDGTLQRWAVLLVFFVYALFVTAAVIFEYRTAIYYDKKGNSAKDVTIYIATIILVTALFGGISYAALYPWNSEAVRLCYLYLAESLSVGSLFFVLLALFITNISFLWVNVRRVDEPWRFFGKHGDDLIEEEKEEMEKEAQIMAEQGSLAESFGEGVSANGIGVGVGGIGGASVNSDAPTLSDKERVFPGLCSVDYAYLTQRESVFEDNVTLKELCIQFRNYLAKELKLYYDEKTIREFIAGLAASRFIILEGLSGTGKSSLARYFSEFISEKSFFEAVQATWRDKTSILGYYNDFSRSYNETEFLKRLYEYSYKPKNLNFMVLDELNISRIEYYFADFLSVLEYPTNEWKIKIMQLPYDFEAPEHLQDGILKIPSNTYFIGTANKDDSTYTITDKVYDRAITINFDDRNEPFAVEGEVKKISISFNKLQSLFKDAQDKEENTMSEKDFEKFRSLADFTYDTFDITYGNRIMHQIECFVPVFVECGGSKEDALDFMFSRKVVAKLDGRFEDYIKPGLMNLKSLIVKTYGENQFPQTNHTIDRLLRKL